MSHYLYRRNTKWQVVKVGDFYTTSASGIRGLVSDITARGNRKVVELVTLEGNVFSTLPKGIRAKVSA